MKEQRRASQATLIQIGELIEDLRKIEIIEERRPGAFYIGRQELIHFHELQDAIVADLYLSGRRLRLPVTTREEQFEVLDIIWSAVEKIERHQGGKRR